MGIMFSFFPVLALILAVVVGVNAAHLEYVFGVYIPYAAVVTFFAGFTYRIFKWARAPVPFAIPTTGGQEKSLPWIKANKLDNPSTTAGVIGRMALEVLLFRSLFRNVKLDYREGRTASCTVRYAQDHLPVKEQREAVGHAVRAGYMYSAMADVATLTGDKEYLIGLDNIWEDVVSTKLYITGGVGAAGNIDGYGSPYELPNLTAYCETCASIALALWNQRMFLTYGDGKYVDVLERAACNAFLSGVSIDGDSFFYPNPLESFSGGSRSHWFECACCPPNIIRFIASFPGLVYATRGDEIIRQPVRIRPGWPELRRSRSCRRRRYPRNGHA